MNNELERIAKEYVRKAEGIYSFMLTLLGVNDRRELTLYVQTQNDIHFEISGKKYIIMPHGRGCFFSDGEDEINWEFGDDRVCGIDCHMLYNYIQHYYPRNHGRLSYSDIQKEFDIAYENNEVSKRDGLFYF